MGDPAFVWVDLETTGLNPHAQGAAVLEAAVVITDAELNEIAHRSEVIKPHLGWDFEDDFVRRMHADNGLLYELGDGAPLTAVERRLEGFLFQHKAHRLPLAGSTISFDRAWLQRFMPSFEKRLHYRNVDVSTLKVLLGHWEPEIVENRPVDEKAHRALADVRQSIEELRHYAKWLDLI